MYKNLDELNQFNERYNRRIIFEQDLHTINRLGALMQEARVGSPKPTDADQIICIHPEQGEITDRGYLQKREDWNSICVYPTIPRIMDFGTRPGSSASGGPWWNFSEEQMSQFEFAGCVKATFWAWGFAGPGHGYDIHFQTEVFAWKVTDSHFYKHD